MTLFVPLMLAAIQAFAGNTANFLGRTLEWPWYAFWVQAFYGTVDPTKVIAGPQYEIVKTLLTNDGKHRLKRKFPDFVLHYLDGFPLNHEIDNIHQVTNHQELSQFHMGRFALTKSMLLAVCEIKALPDGKRIPAGDSFQATLATHVVNIQWEARAGAVSQASLYLASHRGIGSVVAIAAFGPHFSWRVCTPDTVPDVSSNEDPTFVYPGSDVRESDSNSDVPPTARATRATRRAAAAGAIADLPAAGPSERPKRNPHTVRAYAAYRTMEGSLLDSEPSAPEEEDNSKPPVHRAPAENRREANKGKPAAKGKTVAKGKGVGRGKAVNRPGNQKTDGAQNKKNKGHPVQAPPDKPLPLLSLPPLLESTVEQREQATASAGSSSGSSAAVGRRMAGATSADAAHTSDGSDNDNDDGQAVGIPPDELEWSEWYNWASIDGIQERLKMLNAMQRQYPNCPFIVIH
ncbi:hypothetical protein FOMPIDRAFT_1049403 [Fomitopsis schrenkii]|uniref:Uncharacterized protein n=1 Tax=Fomitopsis schrenkii TaxID=2126942 RepID=S8EBG9_FOMSC|nr:hypothetical protein FOMPIDRAFT_1049403 [Fomitopsis schrenkii]